MPSLESTPARGARLALLGALVAPLVVATAAIIVVPNLRFSGMAPRVRPIIETTTLLVAALITGVSYLRYSLDRDRLWLFVSLAFLVVTVHQLVFELILQPNGIAGADPTYLWLAARLEMGVLLLAAASTSRAPRPTDWSAARTYAVFGALALVVLAATQAAVLFATGGPDVSARVITSAADMGTADVLLGSVCASVFLVAAGGLLLSKDREGSVSVWMSAALVMTAFSHLHYLLDPTLFTDRVSTGDLLRIATAGILVVAILADVRRSYGEVRARTIQLEAAYEAQRRAGARPRAARPDPGRPAPHAEPRDPASRRRDPDARHDPRDEVGPDRRGHEAALRRGAASTSPSSFANLAGGRRNRTTSGSTASSTGRLAA
jgi:hypothetical protein